MVLEKRVIKALSLFCFIVSFYLCTLVTLYKLGLRLLLVELVFNTTVPNRQLRL